MMIMRAARGGYPSPRGAQRIRGPRAAVLVDKNAHASAAPAQALAARLRHLCVDHSLGEPLVYAPWARALLFRWPAEDNARTQAGTAFLADAIRVTA
jgi:hypothetical protein